MATSVLPVREREIKQPMTAEEQHEWQYRYDEAISLGRTPERAKAEADEWLGTIRGESTEQQ